jgi:catechol 2,3-dioxygenase-like lactoylglutathione lyase family enzyme
MKITLTSVMVDDQAKARKFYTDILGFVKKHDVPLGEANWLTVVSSEGSADIELLLEPNSHPAARVFQRALYDDGIPLTSFSSTNIHEEIRRLKERGVVFRGEATKAGPATVAVFEDTCGNLIQLTQVE